VTQLDNSSVTTNSDFSTISRDTSGNTIETCEAPATDGSIACTDATTLYKTVTYTDGAYTIYNDQQVLITTCSAPDSDASVSCTDEASQAITVTQADNSSITTNDDGSTITRDTSGNTI
jgi:hypothetical protein